MFEGIGTVLVNPDEFFERRAGETSLLEPVLVVLAVVLLSVVGAGMMILRLANSVSGDLRILLLVGGAIGVVVGAVGPFVSWLLYAIAFHVITYFFDGEGEFRDTFALTGWGYLPRVISAVLSTFAVIYLSLRFQPPADLSALPVYQNRIYGTPLYLAASGLGVLFTLWSAYIWVSAVQHARDVTRTQAAIAVGIPVALGIVLGVVGVLFNTGL